MGFHLNKIRNVPNPNAANEPPGDGRGPAPGGQEECLADLYHGTSLPSQSNTHNLMGVDWVSMGFRIRRIRLRGIGKESISRLLVRERIKVRIRMQQ